MSQLRVGLSGYSYRPWQGEGRFYPPELKQKDYFNYYSSRYNVVEIDGTWYRMPGEEQVKNWKALAPEGFQFCFKAHRQVSHLARLKPEALEPLQFMMKRLGPLGEALGPVLIQLPPNLKLDVARLRVFLEKLPEYTTHKQWAFEFRNDTWRTEEVAEVLRDFDCAFVASETDDSEAARYLTASYGYARLRKGDYSNEGLVAWHTYFSKLESPQYIFCKHEDEGNPWVWADYLLSH